MKRRILLVTSFFLALAVLYRSGSAVSALQETSVPSAPVTYALSDDAGYDLSWWTVDGGGGYVTDESSSYTLGSTAGQPDAGQLAGGGYTLAGGFWAGGSAAAGPPSFSIYLPLVLRSY